MPEAKLSDDDLWDLKRRVLDAMAGKSAGRTASDAVVTIPARQLRILISAHDRLEESEGLRKDLADSAAKVQSEGAKRWAELAGVREAIQDYHFALDTRQHGSVAACTAISVIETALGMPWEQGQEKAQRETKVGVE